ncbi:9430069I07Rik [Phodopus roborovskii]|uniref:9430069I07Rik protein n=1 Tax=Phodopus roborovskii TaxID=109678 RepID=A0AAV0A4H2_PHORO|nr:9430069I07Rik [Phodopus roborovskii]
MWYNNNFASHELHVSLTGAVCFLAVSLLRPCVPSSVYEPGVLMQKWAQLCSTTLHMWASAKEDKEREHSEKTKDPPCPAVLAHSSNPSTWEAEAGRSL